MNKKLLLEATTDEPFFVGQGRLAGFRTSSPEGLPEGYTRYLATVVFISKDSDGVIFKSGGPEMIDGEFVIFPIRHRIAKCKGISINSMRTYMGMEDEWEEITGHPV